MRMAAWRTLAAFLGLLALAPLARAQTYPLAEPPQAGDCSRVTLDLTVGGELRVQRDGKQVPLKLAGRAVQRYTEKLLDVPAKGLPTKAARLYEQAQVGVRVDSDGRDQSLRPERRLVVAQRRDDQYLCYSPSGGLTREELEVVSEHLDTLALTGVLPGRDVSAGETWKLSNPAAWSLCGFEALIAHDLTGRLDEVKDGAACFSVTGTATGIELGALAKLTVRATGRFDLLSKRLVSLTWQQKDEREQGPASPAAAVDSTVNLNRVMVEEPKELSQVALVSVPEGYDPPAALTQLNLRDPKERFELNFGRDWHVVSQTDQHVVMRLLERGDFLAQATLTPWKKADPGKHMALDDFRQLLLDTPGFEMEEFTQQGEVAAEGGRYVYRLMASGTLDGVKVVQIYYLVAGPQGDQAVLAFTMKPSMAGKVGSRDLALVQAVDFPQGRGGK
jgi:hypothetical protein